MSLGVPENKQVGTLTERQRLALAAVLSAKGVPAGAGIGEQVAGAGRVPAPPLPTLAARERALSAA